MAQELQSSWGGGDHLPGSFLEECCTHVISLLHAWVCAQSNLFRIPDPHVSSDNARGTSPNPCYSAFQVQSGGDVPYPAPANVPIPPAVDRTQEISRVVPPSPFTSPSPFLQVLCGGQAPTVAASPFVRLPGRALQPSSPPVEPGSLVGAGSGSGGASLKAGPVRLTRFVELSFEHYYSTVNEKVNAGRFEHIGRATIRVEGASAWGVWLRIDHWPAALGRHPRLRNGVLFHMANRTLSFHGIGSDAVQFLLPLFESWTLLNHCLSCRLFVLAVSVRLSLLWMTFTHRRSLIPMPHDRPQSSKVSNLRGLVQQLVELCRGTRV